MMLRYLCLLLILSVLVLPNESRGADTLTVKNHTLHKVCRRYYTATLSYAQVLGTSPVIHLANRTLKQIALKNFLEFTQGNGPSRHAPPPPELHTLNGATNVTLATLSLVSANIWQSAYDIDGTAHGSVWNTTVSIGLIAGKPTILTLQDLFRRNIDGATLVAHIVYWELKHRRPSAWSGDLPNTGGRAITDVLADRFVITPTGPLFIFNPYEIGSFGEGSLSVAVSFGELRNALDPRGPLKPLLHALRPAHPFHHRGGKIHG